MARKKSKAKPKKDRGADTDESVASSGGGKAKTKKKRASKKKPASEKKAVPRKKSAPKKKPSPENAEEKADPGVETEAQPDPPIEDLDVDLDLDANIPEDLRDLVAEVALLDEIDAVAEEDGSPVVADDPEEVTGPPEAVDAVLDDGLHESDDIEALIALTVAGEGLEDLHDELARSEADDDLPIAILDDELEPDELTTLATPVAAPKTDSSAPPAGAATASIDEPPEQDLDGAIDLGPDSTPELRDRLLAQALAHAELQDARYRVPLGDPRTGGRWKGTVAAVLFLVAAVLAIIPPGWVRPAPPARIDAAERTSGVRTALLLQAQQVDAYRVRFQRLPDSLEELPDRLPGLRFVKSGNRVYQLIGYTPDGKSIIYDSSSPAREFERLAPGWAEGAAP